MTLGNPDPKYRRRLLIALALAVAVHEIVIGAGGFLRFPEAREPSSPQRVILIERRVAVVTPAPTPTPTAPPRVTPAPKRAVAAPRATMLARTRSGGSRGGPKLEIHTPKLVHHNTPMPVVRATEQPSKKLIAQTGSGATPAPGIGSSSGIGTGQGAGAGSQQGPGGGTGGTGSGSQNSDAPCGEPLFYGLHAQFNPKDGSFDEAVRVQLRLSNGQTVTGEFHYPWHYASERENPFSPNYGGSPDDAIPAKLPPPGFDLSKEPLAVQLTLQKTLPNGRTLFQPCPTAKVP
ncbi:MAG: hypothetical protein ACRENA_10335 [Vulcanimicrobiaceae bacterium]